ncbi:hypothetical protein PVAND_012544 [Polypedilum vanderplanki]|uniref:Gustatory receptor n=1 Tax=Polypedilum vanderplanki TaxID=319348 RepID=A0A9J6CMV0_POLVA|nr:hypothetical protein PVAND_012544 [Polypedilum vanderplanki]
MTELLLSKCGRRDLRTMKLKFMARLFVLIIVRLIKFLVSTTYFNMAYAACTMITELVMCSNDFMFAFFVEALTAKINNSIKFVQILLFTSQMRREIEREIKHFSEIRNKIIQYYELRILITTILNLILLVISLYWTTMRIVFIHFERFESYGTFLYFIQPTLCLWTTFYACHNCTDASRKLLSNLFRKDKRFNLIEHRRTSSVYLQLCHQHLRFSIMNAFEMNMRSVCKIISTLSGFFILIAQTFKKDFYQEWTSARMN